MQEISKCSVMGCKRKIRSKKSGLCEMHYYRVRRTGVTYIKEKERKPIAHTGGYVLIYAPSHPMAKKSRAYEHRVVYYNKHGEGPFVCVWCGKIVYWDDLHIDHLNDIKTDNDIANLAASCPTCNLARGMDKMTKTHQRKGRMLTLGDETLCLSEWARRLGVSRYTIDTRILRGWPLSRALTEKRGNSGPPSKRYPNHSRMR